VNFAVGVKLFSTTNNLGSVSLSTNHCQALKTTFGSSFHMDGALIASCMNNGQVKVQLYNDIYCGQLSDTYYLNVNGNFTIDNTVPLTFSLKEKFCDQSNCSIDFTFSQNCSLNSAGNFLNISLPFDLCMSLNSNFISSASTVINDILPSFIVQLLSQSVKLSCCSNDDSLLIVNYSDTSCSKEVNGIRLSKNFAQSCFYLGQIVTLINWKCANYVDCSNATYIDNSSLPLQCDSSCITALRSTNNKDLPNMDTQHSSFQIVIIVVSVICLLIFVAMLYGIYWFTRRKRIRDEVAKQSSIMSTDNTKYEPMIGDDLTHMETQGNDTIAIPNATTEISFGNGVNGHDIEDQNNDKNDSDMNGNDNDNNDNNNNDQK